MQKEQQGVSATADANENGDVRGEGIILLAHHADGNLWFGEKDTLIQEDFQRKFRRGSIALISACAVGGGSGDLAYKLIETLNNRNIDTMIVSPFPVPADFGTALALNFVRSIDTARRANQTPTVTELFAAALSKTAEDIKENHGRNFNDIGLEFVFLGDPNIRLCAN